MVLIENHWGHRNVIFKDIQNLPARPIGTRTPGSGLGFDTTEQAVGARWLDVFNFKHIGFKMAPQSETYLIVRRILLPQIFQLIVMNMQKLRETYFLS